MKVPGICFELTRKLRPRRQRDQLPNSEYITQAQLLQKRLLGCPTAYFPIINKPSHDCPLSLFFGSSHMQLQP